MAPAVRWSLPIPWGQPHQTPLAPSRVPRRQGTPPMTACLPECSLKPPALQMPEAAPRVPGTIESRSCRRPT